MVICKLKLDEEPRIDLYTKAYILSRINPTERIDDGDGGEAVKVGDLERRGYWSDDIIAFIYTAPSKENWRNLVEIYIAWHILEKALPKFIITIDLGEYNFVVAYPNITPAENILELRNWLLRIVQYGLRENKSVWSIIGEVRDYYNMYVGINSKDGETV